jgi:ribosomal peptide maturation radical SAM protein 1
VPFTSFAGEWVFTEALYGPGSRLPDGYVDDVLRGTWQLGAEDIDTLAFARARAADFVREALDGFPWGEFQVVGFTSFFAQNIAALALARQIKDRHPEVIVVFGGYNWHGVMGEQLLNSFPFVDAACTGEGDVAFPRFLERLATGGSGLEHSGLVFRDSGSPRNHVPAPLSSLDELPLPDYDDYFEAVGPSGPAPASAVLSAETSRGCWWAERHPCRFCGLTGTLRAYRSKSRERIMREIRHLAGMPQCSLVELVDNVVSPVFLRHILPELVEHPLPVPVFFETRPEVTRQDIRNIARAGAMVQVGIESLSDDVLRLMGKGSSALQNIRLLRWCAEEGVRPSWNVIYNIPGESSEGYASMMRLLPHLDHLRPPNGCSRMSLDRFSPFFEQADRHAITAVRPLTPYRYLYPLGDGALMNIASAFDYEVADAGRRDGTYRKLRQSIGTWRHEGHPGSLWLERSPSGDLCVVDRRHGRDGRSELDRVDSLLYLACENIATLTQLVALVDEGGAYGESDLKGRLTEFVEKGLMASVDDSYLSLALYRGQSSV